MNRFQSTALTVAAFCIGGGIVGAAFSNDVNGSTGSVVFSAVTGGFCLFAGFVFLFIFCIPAWKEKSQTLKDEINGYIKPNQAGKQDENEDDSLISAFRESVYEFFSSIGIKPNSVVQNTATQLYWHMLYLQKLRMDKKNVSLKFEAERKTYAGLSVTKQSYFDGKYEITEAKERIDAKRTYAAGSHLFTKTDNEVANYNILNARRGKNDGITCPNCGNKATRENLLDGCDYCNTKFTVTDLGKRISNFALRRDYEVEYAKYKDRRKFFERKAFLAGAIPAFILSLVEFAFIAVKEKDGIILSVSCAILGAALLALAMGFFAKIGFFIFIFPFIQLKHSAKYTALKFLKENEDRNLLIADEIRKNDPLFSKEYFFSNIQNKLATIHYADKSEQVSVFAEKDLSVFFQKYSDVIDMDVTNITFENTSFDEKESRIELSAKLNLICVKDSGFYETSENVKMSFVKDSACKTEAVCEPSMLKCKNCGSSVSLLDGGKCQYCGTPLNLKAYDWVIADYRVV